MYKVAILLSLFFSTFIQAKGQDYKIDTIKHYVQELDAVYDFPKITHKDKKIERNVNELINITIVKELSSDTNKTKISELDKDDMESWYNNSFDILYNKNSLLSIIFYFQPKGFPNPFIFIRTIDIETQKLLELDHLLDKRFKNEFYSLINNEINKEIDGAIEMINTEPEYAESKEYLSKCYQGYRNQKSFHFYIEELNRAVIITPLCCCLNGVDSFTFYYHFNKIKKYLNNEYKTRIE